MLSDEIIFQDVCQTLLFNNEQSIKFICKHTMDYGFEWLRSDANRERVDAYLKTLGYKVLPFSYDGEVEMYTLGVADDRLGGSDTEQMAKTLSELLNNVFIQNDRQLLKAICKINDCADNELRAGLELDTRDITKELERSGEIEEVREIVSKHTRKSLSNGKDVSVADGLMKIGVAAGLFKEKGRNSHIYIVTGLYALVDYYIMEMSCALGYDETEESLKDAVEQQEMLF